ncbi:MAG: 50S ribosomal protein L9 [Chromatiales bacterium]|nr:50S ribosomal protein L9 [Chromatiales bacterium]
MDIILLEKVRNLGDLGEQVRVKSGYGRNFLIPGGKAVMATKVNIEKFEGRRAELEAKASEKMAAAEARGAKLAEIDGVTITMRASDEGKLFGSVAALDVVDALNAAGAEVNKREVIMPEGHIRQIGDYELIIQLHSDVNQPFKLTIAAE